MKKQTAKKIAIVTGASSGLGREFVKQIAKSRQLDEIWVIARRRDRLEEVRRLSKVALRTIPLDLTENRIPTCASSSTPPASARSA